MGCSACEKRKQKFLTNVKRAENVQKKEVISLVDTPDEQLNRRQLRSKYVAIRAENRRKRIEKRNARANIVKQQNYLKSLNT